jgi:hypothetical protein
MSVVVLETILLFPCLSVTAESGAEAPLGSRTVPDITTIREEFWAITLLIKTGLAATKIQKNTQNFIVTYLI